MELISKTPFIFAPIVGRVNFPRYSLTLIIKGTFDLVHNGTATISKDQLFPTGDIPYSDDNTGEGSSFYESDFAYFKPCTDLLLSGKCWPPGGEPTRGCRAAFGVGHQLKKLAIFGDRYWNPMIKTISAPQPFTQMELRYENAFGGKGYQRNPVGKGYGKTLQADGTERWQLPNIEELDNLIDSPDSQPEPAGFGPINSLWDQRYKKLGTYEGTWLKERWPWYPVDFDWGYYNAAPSDMQIEGYLKGDESLYFENLHPTISTYRSRLPGLRPRLFIQKQDTESHDNTTFFEPDLRLDTLWVDMEAEKLILVWRAVIDIISEDYKEIQHIFIVAENLNEPEKSREHYHNLFLKEFEQIEEDDSEKEKTADDESTADEIDIDKEIQKIEDELRAAYIAAGIDPDHKLPEPTEEDKQEEARILKELGIETDIASPPLTREIIIDRVARGDSLCGNDLSNLDLSALKLEGVDFSDAILQGVNFEKAILVNSNFTNANLQQASFLSADLKGATLIDTDLSRALCKNADLSETDMRNAIFDQAILVKANLDRCNAENSSFSDADLTDVSFRNAQAKAADFSGSTLDNADFNGTILMEASVEDATGIRVNMEETDLTGLKAAGKTDFSKGSFQRVTAAYSIWENAILNEADFSLASMEGANFASASLLSAVFTGADLKYGRLTKADMRQAKCRAMNLLEATFEQANLTQADFSLSNIYGAEFLDAVIDGTRFENANLKMTKLSKG